MKNLTFLALAILVTSNLFAQKGLEFTVGFTPGACLMINDEDFATGEALNLQGTFGYQIGLTAGYNFNERIGLATGIGFASLGQNYTTDWANIANDDQTTFDRKISYVRIPLLFRFGGDPTARVSTFIRFGPHFDFLSSALGTSYGTKNNPHKVTINFRDIKRVLSGENAKIYNGVVLGLTLEIGGKIRISDQMGILLLFHLESSLTNPEGSDAASLYSGFPTSGTIASPKRAQTFNMMAGLHIGFQYALSLN